LVKMSKNLVETGYGKARLLLPTRRDQHPAVAGLAGDRKE
jgi:hypothetical protein